MRGVNADQIIIEEAAHIDPELFYAVALPIFEVGANSPLVAISSPLTSDNYYSQLIEAKHPRTGQLMAHVVRMEMVCRTCKKKAQGKLFECRHMEKYRPPWKDPEKFEMVAAMFGPERREMFIRESMGVILMEGGNVFTAAMIESFCVRRIPQENMFNAPYVFIFCDPNSVNSAVSDETALVATCFNGRELVVSWNWISTQSHIFISHLSCKFFTSVWILAI